MEEARRFLRKVIDMIKKPEMRILPGQLAFFLVISIIPIIALIGTIASKLSISLDTIKVTLGSSIPNEVSELITDIVQGKGLNFNISVFFISAFLLASNGPHSMIITSNEIYKIEPKDIISRRIKAIFMTVILVSLLVFMFLIPVMGDQLFSLIRVYASNTDAVDFLYKIYQILKYPFIVLIIFFNIKLIYVIAPDDKITSFTTTKGAVFTTIGWVLASEIYSFYTATFTKYDIFYGSISNILVLLLWVYLLSYIFVLGMVINAGSLEEYKTEQLKVIKK